LGKQVFDCGVGMNHPIHDELFFLLGARNGVRIGRQIVSEPGICSKGSRPIAN